MEFEELPTPPGFAPIPLPGQKPSASDSAQVVPKVYYTPNQLLLGISTNAYSVQATPKQQKGASISI